MTCYSLPEHVCLRCERQSVVGDDSGPSRAGRAAQIGYHALLIPDHLLGQLSPAVAMATVAGGNVDPAGLVMNNDLRHPAVLAQDVASIDVRSGGRVELALDAG